MGLEKLYGTLEKRRILLSFSKEKQEQQTHMFICVQLESNVRQSQIERGKGASDSSF